jgi:hypothetical protein
LFSIFTKFFRIDYDEIGGGDAHNNSIGYQCNRGLVMPFQEVIIGIRKECGWPQEDFAGSLFVTRQAA